MRDIAKFVNEVKLELSRVIWPKRDEFIGATIVVIFLVAVLSIYLGLVDFGVSRAINYVIKSFGA